MATANREQVVNGQRKSNAKSEHSIVPVFVVLIVMGLTVPWLGSCATSSARSPQGDQQPNRNVMLVYEREGGLLPTKVHWTFFNNGDLISQSGQIKRVKPDALSDLYDACGRIPQNYRSPKADLCADCYSVKLALSCDGNDRELVVIEGVRGTPVEMTALLKAIRSAIKSSTPE